MAMRDAYRQPHTTYIDHPHAHTGIAHPHFPHIHNPFVGQHKVTLPYNYIHSPPVDIRETATDFYLDLELPGVADSSSVNIQWTSSRTFVVEGSITRPGIEGESASAGPSNATNGQAKATEEKPADSSTNTAAHDNDIILSERLTGKYVRNFDFPVDVDIKGMKAKLEAGLLRIRVPKKKTEKGFLPKVLIH